MQGTVTFFDIEEGRGNIQSDDGRMLSFEVKDLALGILPDSIKPDCRVEFSQAENSIFDIRLSAVQNLLDDGIYYTEPSEVGITSRTYPDGFELLDKSDITLHFEAKTENLLKHRMIDLCRKLGGNVVTDYRSESFERNSIGFSFQMFRGSCSFANIGNKSDDKNDTAVSLYDLKHRLNHSKILEISKDEERSAMGLKIIKISGFILLIIFTLGFLFGKG